MHIAAGGRGGVGGGGCCAPMGGDARGLARGGGLARAGSGEDGGKAYL